LETKILIALFSFKIGFLYKGDYSKFKRVTFSPQSSSCLSVRIEKIARSGTLFPILLGSL
jgi:hypothetical protein